MNLKATLTAKKAAALQAKGQSGEAMKLYQQAVDQGLDDAVSILRYTNLLVRAGDYQKARDLLVQIQKKPMSDENKTVLMCNYAACVYRQGDLEKGLRVLESRHKACPSGLTYETLGYFYVLAGDFDKALAFNLDALEYDDEDPITLDNLGQTYYLLGNDKEKAREYFEKALELKPGQIDTLYFLSRFDIEEGHKDKAVEKLEKAMEGRFSPLNYANREMIQAELEKLGKH